MKAKFLKLAGVKDEKEFYKKFPTEEAFMAKYGKKLKKAVTGWEGLIKPIGMPKVEMANLAKAEGFGLSELQNVDLQQKGGFDIGSALNPIAGVASSIMGGISKINQRSKDIAEYQKYGKVSDVVAQAAASRPERVKKKYVRPEDNLVTNVNPLGTGTNYLAAENGAEIQNTYAPNVMYTDLGYEPLNDSNPKQYKKGGKMKKAKAGLEMFSGISGQLGGMAGSALGGGGGEIGPGAEIGSSIGGLASLIPGLGAVAGPIGSALGGLVGGLFDAPAQKKLKEAKEKVQNNMDNAMITGQVSNFQNANSSFMEDGGWVSNDWQPQVIASFGEHSMKQLLKPDPMMNTLRAGGHLKYYTPPSEEAMYTGKAEYGGQYAMGGDLQVHRGEAEPISTNPYMPNGGETVMFRGPSHDDGGMPISYGNNGVEVEGGEPAQVMKDGGEAESLVVFGNMYIPDYGANEIGDPKAKGMKFKRYIADLSKQEAKQNKITDKATSLVDDSNTNDPFELLAFNSGKAMLTGSQMKLKDIANKKMNTAAVQNAILETAEEHGIDSAELSKTKIAKFGGKFTAMPIADKGRNVKYDPEFESFIDQAMQLEQANSFQAGNYRGGGSNFGTNKKEITSPQQAKEYYYKNYWSKVKDLPPGLRTRALQLAINTGDPYGELMVAAGKMTVDERRATKNERKDKDIKGNKAWEASKNEILKAYQEDPEGFLSSLDKEQNRYYDSLVEANTKDGKAFGSINPDTAREFYDDYTGLAKNVSQQFIPRNVKEQIQQTQPLKPLPQAAPVAPVASVTRPVSGNVVTPLSTDLQPINNAGMVGDFIPEQSASGYIPGLADQIAKARLAQNAANTTMLDEVQVMSPRAGVTGQFPSPTDEEGNYYMPITEDTSTFVDPRNAGWDGSDDYQYKGAIDDSSNDFSKKKGNKVNWQDPLMMAASIASPFLRPRVQNELDPSQLAPEMMAMSMNQLEPVQAQTYQPIVTGQPTSFSLQDQLNEITAQTRQAERLSQGNPEVLANLAAQAYQAKSKVLADQFRMNQAEKQRVAEQNMSVLNDAQLKNLQILDQQYARQSEAKSKTKSQSIEIAKSISDKIAKNKLENRQLRVAENMYPAFNFTADGTAYKNPFALASFNPLGSGSRSGVGELAEGKDYSYNKAGKIIGLHNIKDSEAKNGKIVKAFKNF